MAQIKYNNPGNIGKGDAWQGSVTPGASASFVEFQTLAYGLRALFINTVAKINNGKNTIEKIITSHAPPTENNTENYINHVSEWTGIARNSVIQANDIDSLKKIVRAITRQEHGVTLSDSEIAEGFDLWQSIKKKELT